MGVHLDAHEEPTELAYVHGIHGLDEVYGTQFIYSKHHDRMSDLVDEENLRETI